jgi:hypothetical protein
LHCLQSVESFGDNPASRLSLQYYPQEAAVIIVVFNNQRPECSQIVSTPHPMTGKGSNIAQQLNQKL